MTTSRLLTKAAAAEMLGVNRSTIQRWVARGILPEVDMLGAPPRIRERDLLELVQRPADARDPRPAP